MSVLGVGPSRIICKKHGEGWDTTEGECLKCYYDRIEKEDKE